LAHAIVILLFTYCIQYSLEAMFSI